MLWMRSAGLVLGTTAVTTAAVLACYFAGLGLGSVWARRIWSRPVRLYGLLEIGASAGALWSVAVFWLLAQDSAQVWLSTAGISGRIAAVAFAILPTTLCLGATLPALGQALANAETVGRRGALLYAVNTVGAVVGAAAAGFGLAAFVGVRTTYAIAASASLLAGVIAVVIGDSDEQADAIQERKERWALSARRSRLRLVAAGTGALGLGLEVLWTHLFAQVLHNSIYSFTAIVLVFLLAITLGAALSAAFLLRRAAPRSIAATALVIAAAGTIGGLWLFVYWTDGLAYFGMRTGLVEYLSRITVLAALTVGPAALASAMVLPALWAAWGEQISAAHPLADLTAANLFGGVLGALITGFLIIPTIGVRGSMLLAAAIYLLLADLLAPPQSRFKPLAYAVLLAIVVANPLQAPLVHLGQGETLRELAEGASGIVTVTEGSGDVQLRLDNYYVLGRTSAAASERRQGLLPLLLHPDPQRVAFIGLATGITASAGPALGVEKTTVIELVPEVASAARKHFAPWNGKLLNVPMFASCSTTAVTISQLMVIALT
jgi:spermidine synthase